MKKTTFLLRTFIVSVLMLTVAGATAQEVKRNGVWYVVNPDAPAEVFVLQRESDKLLGTVIIPESIEISGTDYTVVGIAPWGFCNQMSVTKVVLPNTIRKIGGGAFVECWRLRFINIPSSVTTIDEKAFSDCGITSMTIPSSVTYIGVGAFAGCLRLKSIKVDENNPNYCSSRGVLFNKDKTRLLQYPSGKMNITSYRIPNGVTTIEDEAFLRTQVEYVYMPSSVVRIGDFAFGMSALKTVHIGRNVTSIGQYAFRECSWLETVYSGGGDPSSPTISPDLFYNTWISRCALYAYQGYLSYYENNVPWSDFETINSYWFAMGTPFIGDRFKNGDFAYEVTSMKNKTVKLIRNYSENFVDEDYTLSSAVIPDSIEYENKFYKVTAIDASAFANSSALTSVTIPNTIKKINHYAFKNCINLNSITLEVADITDAAVGYEVFQGVNTEFCTLNVRNGQVENCNQLPTWKNFNIIQKDLADGDKFKVNELWYELISLENKTVKVIREITLPTNYNGVPSNIHSLQYIPTNTNYSQREIVVPSTIQYENKAFTVTTIGESAFAYLNTVGKITLPKTITEIEKFAFYDSRSLGIITCLVEDVNNITMGEKVFEGIGYCTLEVPENKTNDYNNAEQWQDFNNVVEVENSTTDVKSLTVTNTVSVIGKNIIVSNNKNEQVKLYDISGKVIYNIPFAKQNLTLQVKKSGVYVLQVNNSTQKVIVR